jgi:hypothetical protein
MKTLLRRAATVVQVIALAALWVVVLCCTLVGAAVVGLMLPV